MNNKLSGPSLMFELNPYVQHKYQAHPLGMKSEAANGDVYRYGNLGADVATGLLLTGVLGVANHHNKALSADAVLGATEVFPTIGATAITAAMFVEGTLVFVDNTPEGQTYEIVGHATSAGSAAVSIKISPGLKVKATTASEVSLIRNQWQYPIIQSIVTVVPVGVAIVAWDVSEASYGWLKTRGVVSVLSDTGGLTIGYFGAISDQVAGAIGVVSDLDQERKICQALETGTATEYNSVYLFID